MAIIRLVALSSLGFVASFKAIACAGALLIGASTGTAQAEGPEASPPKRVVSMNLCTDQLAMLLADPGQLHSVSYIAKDVRASAMTKEAEGFVINHGRAEEIFLMQPDLVVAGVYSNKATLNMLRRLNIRVETFSPANSLDDVRDRIIRMGELLGRNAAAQTLVSDFDARLAQLSAEVKHNPRAVLYYANGYTTGENTLAGQILLAAGFRNAASEAGYTAGQRMPLEALAMTYPDAVITAQPYPGQSRSEDVMNHPVVHALQQDRANGTIRDQNWICGTPYVLRAVEALVKTRKAMGEATE